jgi:hypothetical protein
MAAIMCMPTTFARRGGRGREGQVMIAIRGVMLLPEQMRKL